MSLSLEHYVGIEFEFDKGCDEGTRRFMAQTLENMYKCCAMWRSSLQIAYLYIVILNNGHISVQGASV